MKSVDAESGLLAARLNSRRSRDARSSSLAGLAWLAAGSIAAIGIAVALWIGPPAPDCSRVSNLLRLQASEMTAGLAAADPGAMASARAALDRTLQDLQNLGADPAVLGIARSQWQAATAAVDTGDAPAAAVALRGLREAGTALAASSERSDAQRVRQRDLALAFASMLAAAALIWAGAAMSRQRTTLRRVVHQVSDDLGSGAWQTAMQSLRDDRLGAPSAFDALASGVETVLGDSERRWKTLADLAADWYWETDAQHRLVWLSGTGPLASMNGLDPAGLIGRRHDEIEAFVAPTDGWSRLHEQLDAGRAFRNLEFRVRPPGGGDDVVWVTISGRARLDADGHFLGYEGVGRDVTERRLALERLRASEQRWALMVGLASDYYWETDAEHRVQPLRPEVARRLGTMAEHTEGRTHWEAFPDAMSASQWQELRDEIAAQRPYRGVELDIDIGQGRRRLVSLSGIPRFDGSGRFLGYHGIGTDITMRREAERLLLRHNDALQRAVTERTHHLEQINHDLEAFSRELAHELRTPIGHVQGLAHLLVTRAGDRLASDEMQLLGLQLQAARHMRETVDALLMLARSTVQPLVFEHVDVSALVSRVVDDLPAIPRAAPVEWHVDAGLEAHAAPAALRIVLVNLLGNAAKFTRQIDAPVVRVTGKVNADGHLQLQVQDNGAGFDMTQVDRLFKPFGRLHSGSEFQGTGIGLTIVQRIVERHGGQVTAHGQVGQGAWFQITLLAKPPPAPAQTAG